MVVCVGGGRGTHHPGALRRGCALLRVSGLWAACTVRVECCEGATRLFQCFKGSRLPNVVLVAKSH